MRYAFTIPVHPIPKARARVMKGYTYTPKRTVSAEKVVRATALAAGVKPLGGPVRLSVRFYRGDARPCDLDNLAKLVQDALNGVAWKDDRQIVWLAASKQIDRERPRTEVVVETDRTGELAWDDGWKPSEPPSAGKDLTAGPA